MTMRVLTILQFTGTLSAYLFVTVLLPAIVLHEKIKERDFVQRFFICLLTGNFYVMNLVFLLQLLKISNTVTLILGTVVPAYIVWYLYGDHNIRSLKKLWRDLRKISEGYMGMKTLADRLLSRLGRAVRRGIRAFFRGFYKRWLQWLCMFAVLIALASFYGTHLLKGYGYTASDTPVHMLWINGMSQNQIFIDGVYPFGYHCVIYYLHAVFDIDVYVLMRVFPFVQTLMLHMVLLGFIRLCCRSKYVAYAAVGIYVLGNFLQASTYLRFFAVLPQEYGMIFILPAAYFAFLFFEKRREEMRKKRGKMGESFICLVYFAMSFSMTLAVHFYDTMIAGLLCVGVAAGYLFWFVRKGYFWRVVVTCMISVMVAVLPMAVAFIFGTPLQGSLGWGMNVISGESAEEAGEEGDAADDAGDAVVYYDSEGNRIEQPSGGAAAGDGAEAGTEVDGSRAQGEKTGKVPVQESIVTKLRRVCGSMRDAVNECVLPAEQEPWYYLVIAGGIGALFILGVLFILLKRRLYGAMLLSIGVFMALMSVLQAAGRLGIPELMDAGRCRIYYAYMLPVVFAFVADGVLYFVIWPEKWKKFRNFVSLACVAAAVLLLWDGEFRKQPVDSTQLVTNEAITCLTNIIRDETDFTWTICSANDETQMGIDHGYHYELISFLREMELKNMAQEEEPSIKIPTNSVYFFIEKVPIDYTEPYEGSGQTVSEEGAARDLPNVGGIEMYKGENRWVVMSRLYYWAQEFHRLYPNEMKVYFETDQFICYKIRQNPYRLYDFAIDYGYNSGRAGGVTS